MTEAKTLCRTPNPDKPGTTNIPTWKFDLLRPLIRDALDEGPMTSKALYPLVKGRIGADDLERLGSFNWHITTVRLEMEVRGEIERLPGVTPQQLRRVK